MAEHPMEQTVYQAGYEAGKQEGPQYAQDAEREMARELIEMIAGAHVSWREAVVDYARDKLAAELVEGRAGPLE